MQVLIMINKNLLFYLILESVICKKMNRIYYFNLQFNKKRQRIEKYRMPQAYNISLSEHSINF